MVNLVANSACSKHSFSWRFKEGHPYTRKVCGNCVATPHNISVSTNPVVRKGLSYSWLMGLTSWAKLLVHGGGDSLFLDFYTKSHYSGVKLCQ